MKCVEDHQERMRETKILCPCKECRNIVSLADPNMIRRHLIEHGFDKSYTCWDLHDEMLHDVESNVDEKNVKKLQQLFVNAERPLYNECKKFTKLSSVVKLLDLKAKNNWSDKSFSTLLELLHEAFPKDNELPVSTYQVKKLTCPMGLEVQRIHACPKDCILYRKDYKDLRECPVCMESRYKHKNLTELYSDVTNNGPPAKLLWYLPIIPRLKKLYANPKDAKLLRWHAEEGPKQLGNDIDVYLCPLIDDMIDLWETGVNIYDAYKKERFQLFAMIYCTINDFLAYWNLSGYDTKREKACPVCEKNTHSQWLIDCRKTIYMGHRRLLDRYHPYRKKKKLFDGTIEDRSMAEPIDGYVASSQVADLNITFGKKKLKLLLNVSGKKKNVCESLLGLLLNIPRTIKDRVNARKYMVEMGIRNELAPQVTNGTKMYLQPACYTLSKAEKTSFCECLHDVKVPSDYSANIKNLVSMKDLKLLGMKSHDCHVLLTQMISIAIRGVMPPSVRQTITKLCLFFNMIHSKVIDHEKLYELQRDIILILCQLEMYFPPSFFDVMVHLMSHIVEEIKLVGPVSYSIYKVIRMSPTNVDADVIQLGYHPHRILQYQGYDINGYTFYTKQQDDK
nr:hypothetical protein [Tanacetum cinerariifolium]